MIEPREVLAFSWMWHALFTSLVTISVARAAINVCGAPRAPSIRRFAWLGLNLAVPVWPLQGRWLLTLKFTGLSIMLIDVARIAYQHQILGTGTAYDVSWPQAIIRLIPVPLGPWLVYRIWRRGLTNDDFE